MGLEAHGGLGQQPHCASPGGGRGADTSRVVVRLRRAASIHGIVLGGENGDEPQVATILWSSPILHELRGEFDGGYIHHGAVTDYFPRLWVIMNGRGTQVALGARSPVWTLDGKSVLYSRDDGLFQRRSDAAEPPVRLWSNPDPDIAIRAESWLPPDGKKLAVTVTRRGQGTLEYYPRTMLGSGR